MERSCKTFIEELGSKAPVPGGGGASALVGAVGTALGSMVGALTIGKKKYADVERDINILCQQAEKLQTELLVLIEKDALVFEPLARAYGMPKDTEEEKTKKMETMEMCLVNACTVPIEIMEKCAEAIELHKEFAQKGSKLALSDVGAGVIFCKAALQGASLNVFINTSAMNNKEKGIKLEQRANELIEKYSNMADEIFAKVRSSL